MPSSSGWRRKAAQERMDKYWSQFRPKDDAKVADPEDPIEVPSHDSAAPFSGPGSIDGESLSDADGEEFDGAEAKPTAESEVDGEEPETVKAPKATRASDEDNAEEAKPTAASPEDKAEEEQEEVEQAAPTGTAGAKASAKKAARSKGTKAKAKSRKPGKKKSKGRKRAKGKQAAKAALAVAPEPFLAPQGPEVAALSPRCYRCRCEVDPCTARVTGKRAGSWCCRKCNVRGTQLVRLFGRWPTRSFGELTPEQQAEFWQRAGEVGGSAELEKFTVSTLTQRRSEAEGARKGGSYQPLGYWANLGYNTARIEAECKDKEEHPLLGTTYKVAVKTEWSETVESRVRQELYESRGRHQSLVGRGESSGDAGQQGLKRKADVPKERSRSEGSGASDESNESKGGTRSNGSSDSSASDSTDSDSSSLSSSSSDAKHKKKKKSKKAKGEKRRKEKAKQKKAKKSDKKRKHADKDKARAAADKAKAKERAAEQKAKARERAAEERKQAAAAAAEERKLANERVRLATRTLAKTSPVLASLGPLVKDPLTKKVPEWSLLPAKDALETMQAYQATSQECIRERGHVEDLDWTLGDLTVEAKNAAEAASLLQSMIEKARKHS